MTLCPAIYNAYDMILTPERLREVSVSIDGKTYVPARPRRAFTLKQRLRATWLVFTGRADALVWPGQGDRS